MGLHRHLLISDHLDKFGKINKTIPITVSLFDHVQNLILCESLTKVEHTGAKFILKKGLKKNFILFLLLAWSYTSRNTKQFSHFVDHPIQKRIKMFHKARDWNFFLFFLTLRNLAIAIRIKGSKEILKVIIKEQGGSLVTECKPESHSYFLHCICPPYGLMHHHYELHQVNPPIVIHVNRSHQRVNLCFSWIAAESSEESSQLFGTNITVLVLKGKTDYCSDQTNM